MQGLSSRAHAFSVEALVGKTIKRMKKENGKDSSSPGDTETETSSVRQETYEHDYPNDQRRKAGNTPRRLGECESEPGREERTRTGDSDSNPGREEREVLVELQGSDLWSRFHEIGTEMIITKAGRRMFPSLRVKVRNLDPCQQYYIAMDVLPVDSKRYRYVYHSSQWMVAGNTDHSCIAPRLYMHPDSPCVGETWMRQVISFDRVKLTNNEMEDKGHIILQSMHKYKPRVHVIRHNPQLDLSKIPSLPTEGMASFSFPETEFTTVTAYQNQQITKLKIDRNPFAKGFRDPGRNRGVLDGLMESYPWSLEFKPFTLQLQGARPYPSPRRYSPLPPLLSALPGKKAPGFSALCLQGGIPGHPPSLQPHPLQAPPSHSSPRGPGPHYPHRSHPDPALPYCLYRSNLPRNAHLAAFSCHAKLADSTTDCLLRQTPWNTTINHCL
ncbi:T-box transcription factor TBX22 [Oncorhynchus kisutch]|uniref:T-box transcription factor TBX22 n=1 Tax=Oncorhynchus kisutch TaxID=8019 RepID=UPI0012DFA15E|nr:T-box transcription factor TBX22-like [Oncorhynchus kisutch]